MRSSRGRMFGLYDRVSLDLSCPDWIGEERYKCRLSYGRSIGEPTFAKYEPSPIHRLAIVTASPFDYSLKYTDRSRLLELRRLAVSSLRAGSPGSSEEEIDVIVCVGGELTDTSFSNIALYDGSSWHTPSRPLLAGTKRAELIESHKLSEAVITVENLHRYRSVSLINAMLDLGEITIPVESVVVA